MRYSLGVFSSTSGIQRTYKEIFKTNRIMNKRVCVTLSYSDDVALITDRWSWHLLRCGRVKDLWNLLMPGSLLLCLNLFCALPRPLPYFKYSSVTALRPATRHLSINPIKLIVLSCERFYWCIMLKGLARHTLTQHLSRYTITEYLSHIVVLLTSYNAIIIEWA